MLKKSLSLTFGPNKLERLYLESFLGGQVLMIFVNKADYNVAILSEMIFQQKAQTLK